MNPFESDFASRYDDCEFESDDEAINRLPNLSNEVLVTMLKGMAEGSDEEGNRVAAAFFREIAHRLSNLDGHLKKATEDVMSKLADVVRKAKADID
jgi:hypothetical protein